VTPLSRPPSHAALLPWVQRLWLHAAAINTVSARELCLPSAATRLVLRLQGPAMRSFRGLDDRRGVQHARLQYCGLRHRSLLRSAADSGVSVGVELKPGASLALFGQPADRLAGRYLDLDELLPAGLRREFAALQRAPVDPALLDRVEDLLLACLQQRDEALSLPEHWGGTLAALVEGRSVLALAAASGLSHRAWLQRFRAAVGCTPRAWRELERFSRALVALRVLPRVPLSALALDLGFHDQAHLSRQFAAHAGMGPARHRDWGGAWAQHLALD
jgi:AraC-like DNA-binding protein